MGRRITKIDRKQMLEVEQAKTRYPLPYQQQMWSGWLFWDEARGDDPLIWFLRFPLDEQGLLNQAARDAFLQHLLERVGQRLNASENEALDQSLADSPYTFRPRDDRLAIFHAKAACAWQREPSRFYPHAREYLRGEVGFDQWAFVGIQGLADVAARWREDDNEALLIDAIGKLPVEPFAAICGCLENERISGALAKALIARADVDENVDAATAALRGVSNSSAEQLRQAFMDKLLDGAFATNPVVLAAMVGRAWGDLLDPQRLYNFLQRLAVNSAGQPVFNELVTDLLFIPGQREVVLSVFRDQRRSTELAQAIGTMLGAIGGAH
jgi:hypothetical protein